MNQTEFRLPAHIINRKLSVRSYVSKFERKPKSVSLSVDDLPKLYEKKFFKNIIKRPVWRSKSAFTWRLFSAWLETETGKFRLPASLLSQSTNRQLEVSCLSPKSGAKKSKCKRTLSWTFSWLYFDTDRYTVILVKKYLLMWINLLGLQLTRSFFCTWLGRNKQKKKFLWLCFFVRLSVGKIEFFFWRNSTHREIDSESG